MWENICVEFAQRGIALQKTDAFEFYYRPYVQWITISRACGGSELRVTLSRGGNWLKLTVTTGRPRLFICTLLLLMPVTSEFAFPNHLLPRIKDNLESAKHTPHIDWLWVMVLFWSDAQTESIAIIMKFTHQRAYPNAAPNWGFWNKFLHLLLTISCKSQCPS